MIKKPLQGMLVSGVIVFVPMLGNPAMLAAPKLWILIGIGVLASLFQPDYNPLGRAPDRTDRGTAGQIIWSVYLTQLIILLEAAYYRHPHSLRWNLWTCLALAAMLGGLFIRTWAVFTLKQSFTWHIEVQPNQRIVCTGPYAFVRHPGYAGAFLTFTATAVFLQAWIGWGIAVVALGAAFYRRVRHEEDQLLSTLGQDYQSYRCSVPCFFPWRGTVKKGNK